MKHIAAESAALLGALLKQEIRPGQAVSMKTCAAWDSIKHLEIILSFEEFFGVSFAPEQIPDLTSLDLLIQAVEALGHAES